MREEISNLVVNAMKEAEEYQDSFERYSYLWTDNLPECMKNFLLYGRAVTQDDLDIRAEEMVPKSPPTLTQFQQQVCVCGGPHPGSLPPNPPWRVMGLDQEPGWMVLQCRFYLYSGLVKPADQETAAIGKRVCDSQLPRGGVHMGTPVSVRLEAEGVRESMSESLCGGFQGRRERPRQDEQA